VTEIMRHPLPHLKIGQPGLVVHPVRGWAFFKTIRSEHGYLDGDIIVGTWDANCDYKKEYPKLLRIGNADPKQDVYPLEWDEPLPTLNRVPLFASAIHAHWTQIDWNHALGRELTTAPDTQG